MKPTILNYYSNSYQFQDTAQVLNVQQDISGKKVVILDQTIMYPQGGGQPYDTGRIESNGKVFQVQEVRFNEGLVLHIGKFLDAEFIPGEGVAVYVDEPRRRLHARLHSAGHLIDEALHMLELPWIPHKGFHFPDGPYVEYQGEIPLEVDFLMKQIEEKVNQLIATDQKVETEVLDSPAVLAKRGLAIPTYLPKDKPVRIVTLTSTMPCGGTHVQQLREIGYVLITKIKMKEGNVRVSYQLA